MIHIIAVVPVVSVEDHLTEIARHKGIVSYSLYQEDNHHMKS